MTTEPNLLMLAVAGDLIRASERAADQRARHPRRGIFRRRARTPVVVPDR